MTVLTPRSLRTAMSSSVVVLVTAVLPLRRGGHVFAHEKEVAGDQVGTFEVFDVF
jgi:hypothetical protein